VDALKATPILGTPTKLTTTQIATLARIVRTKMPQQLRFKPALWTLAIIREVIRRTFVVHLSTVSVGHLMKRLSFTPPLSPLASGSDPPGAVADGGLYGDRRES